MKKSTIWILIGVFILIYSLWSLGTGFVFTSIIQALTGMGALFVAGIRRSEEQQ